MTTNYSKMVTPGLVSNDLAKPLEFLKLLFARSQHPRKTELPPTCTWFAVSIIIDVETRKMSKYTLKRELEFASMVQPGEPSLSKW